MLPEFENYLKIVNPTKMSSFSNIHVSFWKQCDSHQDFLHEKNTIPASVEVIKPNFQHVKIGYIKPRCGLTGRKLWLCTDADLKENNSAVVLHAYDS